MSLTKESCERCWLPPDNGEVLCRKCAGTKKNQIHWIRYHEPSSECRVFRDLINTNSYHGAALPENCIQCCNFLLEVVHWIDPLKQSIRITSHYRLHRLFKREFERRREDLLDYITSLLALFIDDIPICKRVLSAFLEISPGKEKWLLEELVQRPVLYQILLADTLMIPYHLTEDFFGHFEDTSIWWAFWETMPASTKRRIRFRCLKIKEELVEKTWAPHRVLAWCVDQLDGDWSH